ncbi:sigma-54-dependent Fis family transcriptional regulator [Bacillus canaveralius]|uniref:Sigma-54-dependent Fis family transcriptional regulator n=1 Tax=Bacillus canaveralius TaxID=1403243 RepID=A0A2N5GQ09_9BACI|nr:MULTISPECIES: sigma-54 dependent transcriptional regulator [Bacillus]PLR83661.1 sigma-54-dependent Fis family transcriptional regulator [Bacillus sp. V33-4]PLR84916.1 sigma-54-dependent Fis family transcriptional regulator [Bacillus canaveralius]PLR95818.1 sigma-54-dependent Fis family transcriptional regulator [Bacillus canaveralius]
MAAVKLLVVDDEKDLLELLVKRLKRKGYDVDSAENAEMALPLLKERYYDVAVYDIRLPIVDGITLLKETKKIQPEMEVLMLTGHGTIETAIEAMKFGAFDYLTKPYNLSELELTIAKAMENKILKEKNESFKKIIKQQNQFHIIGQSPKFKDVLELTKRVSDSDVPVVIEGESGTGKELFAKALHYWSSRADEPFVAVNSGALPEQLLESELFGYIKGAFTGANQDKKGLVEAANGGTLFLDELGEMPLSLQVKLLRFLESGEFRRVGDVRERRVKVRVVAATNRDMNKEVADGHFREDLYYRLNVVKITVPPLRERKEDIPLLINYFSSQAKQHEKIFSEDAMKKLQSYSFPGNVRELHHLVERGLLLSRGNIIEEEDLLLSHQRKNVSDEENLLCTLDELEKVHIEKVLKEVHWNKTKAAEVLGISVRNLYRKIELYSLIQ